MSLQQLLECRFDHGTSQVLSRGSQHDSQLPIAMLKSNLLELLRGCSDTEHPRMVHWSPTNSCEASVSPS